MKRWRHIFLPHLTFLGVKLCHVFAGDRLNLRSCWCRGSRQSEGSEPGASVRQHGLRQGRRHQPRGVHGLLQHQHPRAGQSRRPPLSHPLTRVRGKQVEQRIAEMWHLTSDNIPITARNIYLSPDTKELFLQYGCRFLNVYLDFYLLSIEPLMFCI